MEYLELSLSAQGIIVHDPLCQTETTNTTYKNYCTQNVIFHQTALLHICEGSPGDKSAIRNKSVLAYIRSATCFCVTNWITTPSKARNWLFFIPPAAVDATLTAGRWWGTEAHTFMSHTFNMLSLPTRFINTQRDGNETSPFPSLTTLQTSSDDREILFFSSFRVLLIRTLQCPLTPLLLPCLTLRKRCFDSPSYQCVCSVFG